MTPGRRIVSVSLGATVVFAATQIAAAVHPEGAILTGAVLVALVLFGGGAVLFAAGFLKAVGRSRDESISMAGLVWLAGIAPTEVAWKLRGAVIAQSVIAVATASFRPYTAVAFGILAPMWGMGLLTLWAGHHGNFRGVQQSTLATSKSADATPDRDPSSEDPDDFDQLFRRRKRRSS